jgi:predicted nucleic acid-binding protein
MRILVDTSDVLIASAAISHRCHLFTADKHFAHIAEHSELKLFPPRKI